MIDTATLRVHVNRAVVQSDGSELPCRGYPKHPLEDCGARSMTMTLRNALEKRFCHPAFLVAYAPTPVGVRLTTGVLSNPEALERVGGAVKMQLFLADVDAPGHDASGADAWFDGSERPKVAALLEAHPGLLVYRSRGGYRILGVLPDTGSFELRTETHAAEWARLTLAWRAYLRRRFGIEVDPLKDWTRYQRVPHDTRGGSDAPEELEIIGSTERVALWEPALAPEDWAEADRELAPRAAARKSTEPGAPRSPEAPPTIFRALLEERGLLGEQVSPGKWLIVCPRESEHGKPHGKPDDDDTVLFEGGQQWGAIRCAHSNCGHDAWGFQNWLACFEQSEIDAVKDRLGVEDRVERRRTPTPFGLKTPELASGPSPEREVPEHALQRGDHLELAERVLSAIDEQRRVIADLGALYRFSDTEGYWVRLEDHEVARYHYGLAGTPVVSGNGTRPLRVNDADVRGVLAQISRIVAAPGFFENPPAGVAFRNGFLRIQDDGSTVLEPLAPEQRSRHVLPYDYADLMTVPTPEAWMKFCDALWGNDHECHDLVEEIFGYLISGATDLQKAFVFLGPPRAGKGLLLELIAELMGERAKPFKMSGLDERFALQSLIGASVAIDDDARCSLSALKDTSAITERMLTISANGRVTAPRKFMSDWHGKLGCRMVVAANPPLELRDSGGALASRLVILPFSKSFLGSEDTTLIDKLKADLPAIVLMAIDGLKRLRKNGKFTEPKAVQEHRDQIERSQSPVIGFFRDHCEISPKLTCERQRLYNAYVRWAKQENDVVVRSEEFKQALRKLGVTENRMTCDGVRQRRYIGIALTEEAEEEFGSGGSRKVGSRTATKKTQASGETHGNNPQPKVLFKWNPSQHWN